MGRRKQERQEGLWIATSDVVETPANAFYDRLNQILDEHKFDLKVERLCQKFYKKSPYGRPSLAPVELPGARPVRCRYGNSWVTRWTRPRRTTRPSRVRGDCIG